MGAMKQSQRFPLTDLRSPCKADGLHGVMAHAGSQVTRTCFGISALPNYVLLPTFSLSESAFPERYTVIVSMLT